MKNERKKLIRAMKLADLSGFEQTATLILYEVNGLQSAMQYVNQIMIDRRLETCESK